MIVKSRAFGALLALALATSTALPPAFGGGAAAEGLFDSLSGALGGGSSQGGGAAQSGDATDLDAMKAGALRDRCGGDGKASLRNAAIEQGLGIVGEKELSDYLQGIAGKLIAVSPYPQCRVIVYVTPHDAAQAVALADGGVMVALGFLRNLKNEDEVAALLAHELSHVLKDHHSSDALVDTQDGFLKGLETANASGGMMLGVINPNLQRTANATLSVGDAVYNISESMIAPAWTSDQEDEADRLGTDLLVAAGYNPRAMASIMDVVAAQEANAAAVEAERDKLYDERLKGAAMDSMVAADSRDTTSIVGAVAGLTSAIASGSDKKTHRPAAERKESVNAYIRKHHNDERRRQFAAEAWRARTHAGESGRMFAQYEAAAKARRIVFTGGDLDTALADARAGVAGAFADDAYPRLALSEVRLKQGRQDDALKNLDIALKRDDAPWQIYRSYADLQLAAGDTGRATQTVAAADRRFGEPLSIAPYAIKVYRAANDQAKVDAYMQRCRDGGSRAQVRICEVAAGIRSETDTSRPAGGSGGVGGFLGNIMSR